MLVSCVLIFSGLHGCCHPSLPREDLRFPFDLSILLFIGLSIEQMCWVAIDIWISLSCFIVDLCTVLVALCFEVIRFICSSNTKSSNWPDLSTWSVFLFYFCIHFFEPEVLMCNWYSWYQNKWVIFHSGGSWREKQRFHPTASLSPWIQLVFFSFQFREFQFLCQQSTTKYTT